MAYLGGQVIDGIVAGPYQRPALAAGPAPLRDVLLASGRATDHLGLNRFEAAVDEVLAAAREHQILYAIVFIAAAQMRRAVNPYVTVVLPGENLRTAVAKLDPAAEPFADAKGLTFNPAPSAVYAVDEQGSAEGPLDQKLTLAATLIHEYTHVALAHVYDNDSLPWRSGDERNAAGALPGAHQRVTDLLTRFEKTPAHLGHPEYFEHAGPWLRNRCEQILVDLHGLSRGTAGKLASESVPYYIEGTFLTLRYDDWTLFFNSAPINITDYQRLIWPDLLAGEAAARLANTVAAPAYPGPHRVI